MALKPWIVGLHQHLIALKRRLKRFPSVGLPSPEQLLGVKPVMVNSEEQWDHVWPSLQKELSLFPVLGFDCEWVSVNGRVSTVSLLQIASYSGLCILVRLVSFRGGRQSFPPGLIEVLRDPHVLKVGVGCYEDGKRLTRDYGLSLRCTVDLCHLVLRWGHVALNNSLSLRSLAKDVLNVSLDKSLKLRCSDWEADQLTPEQMAYAARDSQVSIALFLHILGLHPGADSLKTTRSSYSQLAARCQGLIDVPFRQRKVLDGEEKITGGKWRLGKNPCDSPESVVQHVQDPCKNSKRKPLGSYPAMKSPPYQNECFIRTLDGQPLGMCSKRKGMWYISKTLGELHSEDPFVVRLLFKLPVGRPPTDPYYHTVVENICVVCGNTDLYIKKHIVPHEYSRYFHSRMKTCHDIVLLCPTCHASSGAYDNMLKQQLAVEYDTSAVQVKADCYRVLSAARALVTARDHMPENQCKKLEAVVRGFYCDVELETERVPSDAQTTPLSPQVLQAAIDLARTRMLSNAYVPHGLVVVRAHAENGLRGLFELQRRWRQHFLTHMKPRHLPPHWSVDHNHSWYLMCGEDLPIHPNNKHSRAEKRTMKKLSEP